MLVGTVVAVSRSTAHYFHKTPDVAVHLRTGHGIEGDAHAGATVQHRSRVARDPSQPNLRQVHLIAAELFTELETQGFAVRPGELGENITTQGIDLLALPTGTQLQLGESAVVVLTGLRNPCAQLDQFQPGLMAALRPRDHAGNICRKAGVMAIVVADGTVRPGDTIQVTLPELPHQPLEPV